MNPLVFKGKLPLSLAVSIAFEPDFDNRKYCPGMIPFARSGELMFLLIATGMATFIETSFNESLILAFGNIKYIAAITSKNPMPTKDATIRLKESNLLEPTLGNLFSDLPFSSL